MVVAMPSILWRASITALLPVLARRDEQLAFLDLPFDIGFGTNNRQPVHHVDGKKEPLPPIPLPEEVGHAETSLRSTVKKNHVRGLR